MTISDDILQYLKLQRERQNFDFYAQLFVPIFKLIYRYESDIMLLFCATFHIGRICNGVVRLVMELSLHNIQSKMCDIVKSCVTGPV